MDNIDNDANTNSSVKDPLPLPSIPGLREIPLSEYLQKELGKGARESMFLYNPGTTYLGLKYYVSNDALAVICGNINRALLDDGFKFISSKARLNSSDRKPYGAFTKPNGPDLLISVNYASTTLESMQRNTRKEGDPMLEFMIPMETNKYVITVIGARGMAARLSSFINKTFK